MKVLDFGKYSGKVLAECPESYLKWLANHPNKPLAERNRWASRDARFILERSQEPCKLKEKKVVKVLIETGSESHTTSSASVIAKFVGGEYDGQMMYTVKKYVTNTRWYDSNNKHKRWVETIFELPEGTKFEVIGNGRTGARGADKHEFHKVFIVSADAEVLETTIDVGLRDTDLKGRIQAVKDVLSAKKAASKAARTEGF